MAKKPTLTKEEIELIDTSSEDERLRRAVEEAGFELDGNKIHAVEVVNKASKEELVEALKELPEEELKDLVVDAVENIKIPDHQVTETPKINQIATTPEQVALIKATVAKEATDAELQLFLYQARKTGLDPLARQIYFMKRFSRGEAKVTIQTSIDGFRVVAQRSGEYAGQDAPIFEEKDGYPVKCEVNVYKFSPNGQRYLAGVGVAYWKEYLPPQGQDFMWQKMPHTMLSKVAEALALRKAFPQDLSGVYTQDEMAQDVSQSQSNGQVVNEPQKPFDPPNPLDNSVKSDEGNLASPAQVKYIYTLLTKKGVSENTVKEAFHIKSMNEMTGKQARQTIDRLKAKEDFS